MNDRISKIADSIVNVIIGSKTEAEWDAVGAITGAKFKQLKENDLTVEYTDKVGKTKSSLKSKAIGIITGKGYKALTEKGLSVIQASKVAKSVSSVKSNDFMILKKVKLKPEGTTKNSLDNAKLIKESGYEVEDLKYTYDKAKTLWKMNVDFLSIELNIRVNYTFEGFSVGYGGEGPHGMMEFSKIFDLGFDEKKVLEHGVLPEKGTLDWRGLQ